MRSQKVIYSNVLIFIAILEFITWYTVNTNSLAQAQIAALQREHCALQTAAFGSLLLPEPLNSESLLEVVADDLLLRSELALSAFASHAPPPPRLLSRSAFVSAGRVNPRRAAAAATTTPRRLLNSAAASSCSSSSEKPAPATASAAAAAHVCV